MSSIELLRLPIPADQKILLGKPTEPPPSGILLGVKNVLERIKCKEAHFPQYFMLGAMDRPRLVLVLLAEDAEEVESMGLKSRECLTECLPTGTTLDVMVMPSTDPLLPAIRRAGCGL